MYLTADFSPTSPTATEDPIERELREIEDLRRRALQSRDILYCSAAVRHLVEKEIPRLLEIIRKTRGRDEGGGQETADLRVLRAIAELRREVEVVRDLVERT